MQQKKMKQEKKDSESENSDEQSSDKELEKVEVKKDVMANKENVAKDMTACTTTVVSNNYSMHIAIILHVSFRSAYFRRVLE